MYPFYTGQEEYKHYPGERDKEISFHNPQVPKLQHRGCIPNCLSFSISNTVFVFLVSLTCQQGITHTNLDYT